MKTSLKLVEHISLFLANSLFELCICPCTNNNFVMNLQIGINLQNLKIYCLLVIRSKHFNTLNSKVRSFWSEIFMYFYLASFFPLEISYQCTRPLFFCTFIWFRAYCFSLLLILISIEPHKMKIIKYRISVGLLSFGFIASYLA